MLIKLFQEINNKIWPCYPRDRASLASVAILYAWFVGSSYSTEIMEMQQRRLRAAYDLPPSPIITNKTVLQTPPSLRDLSSSRI